MTCSFMSIQYKGNDLINRREYLCALVLEDLLTSRIANFLSKPSCHSQCHSDLSVSWEISFCLDQEPAMVVSAHVIYV